MLNYKIITPVGYNEGDAFQLEFECWMPFDIVKGLDTLPPDNNNYTKMRKRHWWVCPKTERDVWSIHEIEMFISDIPTEVFNTREKAVRFATKWRKEWLKSQLTFKTNDRNKSK